MKTLALAAIAAVSLAPAALAQTAQPAPPAPTAAATPAARFNLDTPIQDIVADDKAKAALEGVFPGISTHESYEMFKAMSLNQVAPYSNGLMSAEALAKAQKALAAVK